MIGKGKNTGDLYVLEVQNVTWFIELWHQPFGHLADYRLHVIMTRLSLKNLENKLCIVCLLEKQKKVVFCFF